MNRPARHLLRWALLLPALPASLGLAQDRVFNYTYQSLVLGPGQRELEVWNTYRTGREEFFRSLDQRMEFEVGLAPRLQTAFYLNIRQLSERGGAAIVSETELSFSNEWKLKLADPVADPVGIALYGEFTVGSREVELEPRLILDKSFGPVLLAFNAAAEFGFEQEIGEEGEQETAHETSVELDLAASAHLAGGLWLGVETVTRGGFEEGRLAYAALFAGPTLSYARDAFWANLSLLPQLTALKGATSGGLVLSGLERIEARLLFSYAF